MSSERRAMIESVLLNLSCLGKVTHQEILEHCHVHCPSAIDGSLTDGTVNPEKWKNYLKQLHAEIIGGQK
jgi:hypothetical protein